MQAQSQKKKTCENPDWVTSRTQSDLRFFLLTYIFSQSLVHGRGVMWLSLQQRVAPLPFNMRSTQLTAKTNWEVKVVLVVIVQ